MKLCDKITALFVLLAVGLAYGQDEDRTTIINKLEFYYYDDHTSSTYLGVDNEEVGNGTENGSFWSNANAGKLKDFVRALLKSEAQGGDLALQHYTAKVLNITNRKIQVYLWNDMTIINRSNVASSHDPGPDSNGRIWPHAAHWTVSQNPDWGGYMDMGLYYIDHTSSGSNRSDGLAWLKETFLHELMHTQDKTLQLGDSFIVMGHGYRYGFDGSHNYWEAVPNNRLAYMEAIASVPAYYYNFDDFTDKFAKFVSNHHINVEINAPSQYLRYMRQLFGYNDHVWLYDEIVEATGNAGVLTSGGNHRLYRIQDLPGKFILHNETVMSMMMVMTSMHVAEIDPFIWASKTFNDRISRNQYQDPFALFVEIFAEGMLQSGETVADIKQELDDRSYSEASFQTPYTFVLPLAYSDYFTAYTSNTKDEFKALFDNELDNDLIDVYWDHFKDNVRINVPIRSGRTWTDMTNIANECGVNQSYLPGTSGRRYEEN